MATSYDVDLSRKMAWALRHGQPLSRRMSSDGYVPIDVMLALEGDRGGKPFAGFSETDVVRVTENNKKKRFDIKRGECGELCVRANQGHTVDAAEDEALLTEIREASELDCCVHGTYWENWAWIRQQGLKTMGRQHIHFTHRAPNAPGETISGMRSTCEVMVFLDWAKALAAGMRLFRSSNGVILTRGFNECVKPEFFSMVSHKTFNLSSTLVAASR